MHIEPGLLSLDKLAFAAVSATGLLATHALPWLKKPQNWLRTALAAFFFSVLMEIWYLPVGGSELHMVGAMPIYLLFGFLPTLFGFFIGLLLQGALFEPQDLVHLAVNFLTLAAPLLAVHHTLGKKLQGLSMAHVLKLDAAYYAGVTGMVGFWLLLGREATPLADWALFAASYGSLVMLEPPLTLALLWLARKAPGSRALQWCLDENWQQHANMPV